jgi:prepilin-type N-terminal cleavage/methylation domain-containing protein
VRPAAPARAPAAGTPGPAAPPGFSLAEVLVAMTIISVVLLILVGATAASYGQLRASQVRAQRAAAVERAVEQVYATPYGELASGAVAGGERGYTASWLVLDEGLNLRRVAVITTGPGVVVAGVVASVTDTVWVDVARP